MGNPLLTLALCSAFAGPLLKRCGAQGGGIHLAGNSSTGKTTSVEAARNVWDSTTFARTWRATANGLEGGIIDVGELNAQVEQEILDTASIEAYRQVVFDADKGAAPTFEPGGAS